MRTWRLNRAAKFLVIVFLLVAVAATQFAYDEVKYPAPQGEGAGLSPEIVRMVDMGFHSTVASFLWVATMPDILDLFQNKTDYLTNLSYLNAVDPRLSYPYAFSVITLPAVPTSTGYTTGLQDAAAIGSRGIANANPDWRIPYYMALNDYLGLHDSKDAAWYFSIAGNTPGVPYFAKRFAQNFGIGANDREQTRELWQTIYDSTNDPDTKARAQAYIDRLDMFDYLEAATAQYKKEYGKFPTSADELVQKNIIPAVPQDPFGYSFIINSDGTAGINLMATSTSQ